MFPELTKLGTGAGDVDWYGLFGVLIYTQPIFNTFFLPPILVFMRLDPLTIFLDASTKAFLWTDETQQNIGMNGVGVKGIALFLLFVTFSSFGNSVRNLWLCILTTIHVSWNLIKYLLIRSGTQKPFSRLYIDIYRETQVATKVGSRIIKSGLGIILGSFFQMMIIGMNLLMFGYEMLPFTVYSAVPVFIAFLVSILVCVFGFCCGIHEMTGEILENWKTQFVQSPRQARNYNRRAIRCLTPASFPVGDIGIMDKEIQTNYCASLIDWLISTSFMVKDWMGQ